MTTYDSTAGLPRSNDDLSEFHFEVASAFEWMLPELVEGCGLMFGEKATQAALRALLFPPQGFVFSADERDRYDKLGYRIFLAETSVPDAVEMTQLWRDGAEYAGQGLAPHERDFTSIEDREQRVKKLIADGKTASKCGFAFVGNDFNYLWDMVAARAELDFGARVSFGQLQLLSGLSLSAIRHAASVGELHPDEAGRVAAAEATQWLARRREFCLSRWRDAADPQWAFDTKHIVTPDAHGMIWVPQAAPDDRFTPDRVVRRTRGAATISITIGAKGDEDQFHDFYEALHELAKRDVPRWRRRNSVGNWGIVRARGAWVAVEKAEIDRQLAAKLAEV